MTKKGVIAARMTQKTNEHENNEVCVWPIMRRFFLDAGI